uniref:Secreted protein n=1 Tax=Caenorhabditis tropicalis TaxID=1561998 RepID=A0A1I7TIK0_9PELO
MVVLHPFIIFLCLLFEHDMSDSEEIVKRLHDVIYTFLSFSRHKRRRHYRDGGFRVDNILAQMDSFVRPRFGRSIGYAEWRDHGHTGIDVT